MIGRLVAVVLVLAACSVAKVRSGHPEPVAITGSGSTISL